LASGIFLARFPITRNQVIEKESLKIMELECAGIEKADQLFKDMIWVKIQSA